MSPKPVILIAVSIALVATVSLLLVFTGMFQTITQVQADNNDNGNDNDDNHDSDNNDNHDSDLGISSLNKLGDRIDGLETPGPPSTNSRKTFGDIITCAFRVPCFGTDKDDVIYPGAAAQSFALDGADIVFGGGLADQVYGGDDDDLLIAGAGRTLLDGGPNDDTLLGGLGNALLIGGNGNDKIFGGPAGGGSVMFGGKGANHFNCPLPALGLSKTVVMDYNPSNGDTLSGSCRIVNTIGDASTSDIPSFELPDTGESVTESGSAESSEIVPGTGISSG
jgi:Ca2+-binding RTX toxin-like protein